MLHEQHLDIPLVHAVTDSCEAGLVLLIRKRQLLRKTVKHVECGGSAGNRECTFMGECLSCCGGPLGIIGFILFNERVHNDGSSKPPLV